MTKWQILVAVVGLVFLLSPAVATADGPGSCSVWGIARTDGADANRGILVTAIINGDEYHTYTPTEHGYSTYSIIISPPANKSYPDGTKVSFKVNGHPAGQSATFKAGASIRLDLTASTGAASSLPTLAMISILLLALLAAASAAYYFLFRRRGVRITDWLARRGGVQALLSAPSVAEGQGQLLSRYIWDNAKLAWVPNTQQVQSKPRTGQRAMGGVRANVPTVAGTGTPQQSGQDTSVAVHREGKSVIKKQTITTARKGAADDPEMLALYHGDVKLLVATSLIRGPLPTFTTHLRQLRRTHQLRVLKIEAVSRQSARFELWLERPLPLLKILKALPEVEAVSGLFKGSRDTSPVTQAAGNLNAKIVQVKLKDSNGYALANTRSKLNTRIIEVELK